MGFLGNMMGGGGPPMMTPPINPASTPGAYRPGMGGTGPVLPMPTQQAPMGSFYQRLAGGLFGGGPEGMQGDPSERNRAMLQLGLGMLAAGSQGQGFGQGLFNAYTGAANTYQGAMNRAFERSEAKRLEAKADRRQEILDQRYEKQIERESQMASEREANELERLRMQMEQRAELAAAELRSRERVAGMAGAGDRAMAQVRLAELEDMKRQSEILKGIEDKVRAGRQLTDQERQNYMLIRTGRMPTPGQVNPGAFFDNFNPSQPTAPGMNPLLSDPLSFE